MSEFEFEIYVCIRKPPGLLLGLLYLPAWTFFTYRQSVSLGRHSDTKIAIIIQFGRFHSFWVLRIFHPPT